MWEGRVPPTHYQTSLRPRGQVGQGEQPIPSTRAIGIDVCFSKARFLGYGLLKLPNQPNNLFVFLFSLCLFFFGGEVPKNPPCIIDKNTYFSFEA